ncbi:MAG: hypothetical protein ACE148_09055 [Vicinamibacterales bacterium]
MFRFAAPACLCLLLGSPVHAAAQARVDKLALVFQEIFGPNGLRVSSEQVLPDGSTHTAHFNSAFQSNFNQMNVALASQLTSLPLPSPASGFTYAFDGATGTFVRSTQSFGPILTDRAETIGRGKFSFGYAVQFFSFDTLEGMDLSAVPAVFTHDDFQLGGGRTDVVTTRNSVEVSVAQATGVLTYGITNRLDVSVAVPLVHTRLSVRSDAHIIRVGTPDDPAIHFFRDDEMIDGHGSDRQFFSSGSATGLGDVIVRLKATALREGLRALAFGVDVRAPTGDEMDLLGAGAAGVRPFVAFSFARGRVSPHVNVGYQWNGRSVLAGDVRGLAKSRLPDHVLYAVGADVGVNARLTLALDLLGARIIDSPRIVGRSFTASGPGGTVTLPDIGYEVSTFSTASGAAGFKMNVGKSLLAAFNLRFKIGDAGLGDRAAVLAGVEYGF